MHMLIRYHILANLHVSDMSQNARETKAFPEYSVELNYCSYKLKIVIIGPKPYQSTHFFLYTIENSPMDFSRESQTSTNTSEFEH